MRDSLAMCFMLSIIQQCCSMTMYYITPYWHMDCARYGFMLAIVELQFAAEQIL